MYRATPQWSVYGNYASGFRAPEAQQVNNVFEGFNAKLLPNPNLKPEKSQNVEIGLRTRLDQLSLDVAAFTGRYTNLIQEKKDLGTANGLVASPANPTLFRLSTSTRPPSADLRSRATWLGDVLRAAC